MAKGKKNVLKGENSPEDPAVHKVPCKAETKENKPATSKSSVCKGQSVKHLRDPSKPRSPLSDSSGMLIQEGNDFELTHFNVPTTKVDISCESKPEVASNSHVSTEQAANKSETTTQPGVKSTKGRKTSSINPRSRTDRKNSAKNAKKAANKTTQNKKVTDYFPIRRSDRKTITELRSEKHRYIDELIKNGTEEGMEVRETEGKGRGVFAIKDFKKGDYVVEYHGDLLELSQAKAREQQYAQDPQMGCYMYYFQYQSKSYCIDATRETGRLGRLLNHSKAGNCQTRLHDVDGTPHLILLASRDIKEEEELLYDYGDRSKDSISSHPWLKH